MEDVRGGAGGALQVKLLAKTHDVLRALGIVQPIRIDAPQALARGGQVGGRSTLSKAFEEGPGDDEVDYVRKFGRTAFFRRQHGRFEAPLVVQLTRARQRVVRRLCTRHDHADRGQRDHQDPAQHAADGSTAQSCR